MRPTGRTPSAIHFCAIACWALLVLACALPSAAATKLDEQPLDVGTSVAPGAGPNAAADVPAPTATPFSSTRMIVGLAVVLATIWGLKWVGEHVLGRTGVARPGVSVRVLGRTPLAPKQQVLLLHVGRRVLVVADSHGRMNALCEIAEPDEVAALVGTLRGGEDSPEKRGRFGSALRRAAEPFAAELPGGGDEPDESDRNPDRPDLSDRPDAPEVNGLLDRVREMRQQFKSA